MPIKNIPFYDLKSINSRYLESFSECLQRVISSGIHMIGEETRIFENSFAVHQSYYSCEVKFPDPKVKRV